MVYQYVENFLIASMSAAFTSVSYTHLDVYKRQATTKNMVLSEVLHDDVPYVFAHTFENEFVSNLTFFDDGNIENFMVSLNKYSIISLYEKDKYGSSDPVISLVDKSSWDFVANIHILDVDVSKSEVTYKATVGRTIDRYKYIKDYTAKKETDITDSDGLFDYMKKHDSTPHTIINAIQGSQTGTSEFTLSPSGNHGTADSVHSVKVTKEFPLKEHYKRDVIAVSYTHLDVYKRQMYDWQPILVFAREATRFPDTPKSHSLTVP